MNFDVGAPPTKIQFAQAGCSRQCDEGNTASANDPCAVFACRPLVTGTLLHRNLAWLGRNDLGDATIACNLARNADTSITVFRFWSTKLRSVAAPN